MINGEVGEICVTPKEEFQKNFYSYGIDLLSKWNNRFRAYDKNKWASGLK